MSAIYKDGAWYGKGGGGGDTSSVELTQLEYDALTEEEKLNGTVYYITDAISTSQIAYVGSKFNRSDIYKETEEVIGSYLGKPLYQKVVKFGSVPNTTSKSVPHNISNMDMLVEIKAVGDFLNADRFLPIPRVSNDGLQYGLELECTSSDIVISSKNDYSSIDAHVILKYTKTTDTANSAIYASENDYSTDETIIGKWVDGKPLYQKTFTGTIPSSVAVGWHALDDDTTKMYKNSNGYVVRAGGDTLNVTYSNSISVGRIQNKLSYGILDSEGVNLFGNGTYNITIQYTKTTD